MNCSNCNSAIPDNASFCSHCGQKQKPSIKCCDSCGVDLSPSAQFCSSCGKPVKNTNTRLVHKGITERSKESLSSLQQKIRTNTKANHFASNKNSTGITIFLLPEINKHKQETTELIQELSDYYKNVDYIYLSEMVDIANQINNEYNKYRQQKTEINAIVILADTDLIPHFQLPDSSGHDECVLTDNPFGFIQYNEIKIENMLIPEVAVTRVPFNNIDEILTIFHNHKQSCKHNWDEAIAISAATWTDITREIVDDFASSNVEIISSPDEYDNNLVEHSIYRSGVTRLHVNLHGSNTEPDWYGESDDIFRSCPVALSPDGFNCADGAIIVAECCYGAKTQYPRLDGNIQQGISSLALLNGTRWFVGSTIIAWGAVNGGSPSAADEITRLSWLLHDESGCIVKALMQAKISFAESIMGSTDPADINTLLSFVCYGFPAATKLQNQTSSMDIIRNRMNSNNRFMLDGNAISQVREKLRNRLKNCQFKYFVQNIQSLDELVIKGKLTDAAKRKLHPLLGQEKIDSSILQMKSETIEINYLVVKKKMDNFQLHVLANITKDGNLFKIVSSKIMN